MKNLLEVLEEQRKTFIRTCDGRKIITNPEMYYACEEESLEIQKQIGRENKKMLIKEGLYIKNKL